jgi:multisubunit Na+/H+ antiporter MnhF subunit
VIVAAGVVLVAAAACFVVRLLRGPSLADRVLATNGLLLVGMAAIAAHAVATGSGAFVPTIVVVALVGFIGTAIIARFIEARGTS